jgi:hypothetical protein
VAEDYWRNRDLRRAQDMIGGWDSQALRKLIDQMQRETRNADERQHLLALAGVLQIPVSEQALFSAVFGQKAILLTAILAVLPLLAAIGLGASLLLRRSAERKAELEVAEAEEGEEELDDDELLPDVPELAPGAQAAPGEEKKDEKLTAEEVEGQADVQDLLNSLFDDDNEGLERLEALSKGLTDVKIDDLAKTARDIIDQRRHGRPKN